MSTLTTPNTVPLDGQARAFLEAMGALKLPAVWDVPATVARAQYVQSRAPFRAAPQDLAELEDLTIAGPGGPLKLRRYRASTITAHELAPGIVFFHGGGWVVGDLESHDALCRALANAVKGTVIAVDYRLAPEHPFPAAYDDALAATQWVAAQLARFHIHPDMLAVAGDSAGGQLAASVAIAARDANAPRLAMQALIYPVTDLRMNSASMERLATGYGLTREAMRWYWKTYAGAAYDVTSDSIDWRLAPAACGNLAGVAPAYIIIAGYDPLRDEGEAYAERLNAAGVVVVVECFEGMIHGFAQLGGRVAAANHAVARIAQGMRQHFGLARAPGAARHGGAAAHDGD